MTSRQKKRSLSAEDSEANSDTAPLISDAKKKKTQMTVDEVIHGWHFVPCSDATLNFASSTISSYWNRKQVDSNDRVHGVACLGECCMNVVIPNVHEHGHLLPINAWQTITIVLPVYFIIEITSTDFRMIG